MRWHDQNGTRRMAHHVFRDAPHQYMFETSQSVRRCNNQIDIVIFCERADIQDWRAFREDRLKFYASEVYRPHELPHFALGSFPSSLLQTGYVIQSSALT